MASSVSTTVPASASTSPASVTGSYNYDGDVRVGATLPGTGVTYYDVPSEYNARGARYTIVNDRPVLVDRSRRIVEVID